jgi:hypothetical protein
LEPRSAAYHNDKVKLIVPFNSDVIKPKNKPLPNHIRTPVVLVTSGPKGAAYQNVSWCQPEKMLMTTNGVSHQPPTALLLQRTLLSSTLNLTQIAWELSLSNEVASTVSPL